MNPPSLPQTPMVHTVHFYQPAHQQRFLWVLQALHYPVERLTEPKWIRFTSPAPLSDVQIAAVIWYADTLSPRRWANFPLAVTLAELVEWHQTWEIGQRLCERIPFEQVPEAMHRPLRVYLSAWNAQEAELCLNRHLQHLCTPVVAAFWLLLTPADASERRHLCTCWKRWSERYHRRHLPFHPEPPVPSWMEASPDLVHGEGGDGEEAE